MNTGNYNKLKNISIIVLVLCNLVCLWFLFGKPALEEKRFEKGDRDQWFIENILKKKIGLDDQQVSEFMDIKQNHMDILHSKMNAMHELRKELVDNMGNEKFDLSEHIKKTGKLQSELDSMAFVHFSELRTVCRPEQYEAFDDGFRFMMLGRKNGEGRRIMRNKAQ